MNLKKLLQQFTSSSNEVELRKHLKRREYFAYATLIKQILKQESVSLMVTKSNIFYFNDSTRVIETDEKREYQTKVLLQKLPYKTFDLCFSKEEEVINESNISIYNKAIDIHFMSISDLIKSNCCRVQNFSDFTISNDALMNMKFEKLFFKKQCSLINHPDNTYPGASVVLHLNQQNYVMSVKCLTKQILDYNTFTIELCHYKVQNKVFYSLEIEIKNFDNDTINKIETVINLFN